MSSLIKTPVTYFHYYIIIFHLIDMQQDLHKVCEAARTLESMHTEKGKLYPKGMTVTSSKGWPKA